MTLVPPSEHRDVSSLSEREKEQICDFIQGAVYCWCENRQAEWFSMRDLMGGENGNWEGTPFDALYQKHRRGGLASVRRVDYEKRNEGWDFFRTASLREHQGRVTEFVAPRASPAGPATAVKSAKTGRNEPCPCGSGVKFKKCCGT